MWSYLNVQSLSLLEKVIEEEEEKIVKSTKITARII